jgi:hypothetical protein
LSTVESTRETNCSHACDAIRSASRVRFAPCLLDMVFLLTPAGRVGSAP